MQHDERDPHAWILKALREAGSAILSEFYGLPAAALNRRPHGNDRSPAEIAAHLRDSEALALEQMTAIIDGPGRSVPTRDVEDPSPGHPVPAGVDDDLAEFRLLRGKTARLLWTIADDDWRRTGRHPYRGEITIEEIARELARHDLEHLWEIRRLRADPPIS